MGLRKFSRSSYDKIIEPIKSPNPNPDPMKCSVLEDYQIGNFLVVVINYINCTTFEGNKILVYKDINIHQLKEQMKTVGIDPHFSSNTKYYSPIARFIPTSEGMDMAVFLCRLMMK